MANPLDNLIKNRGFDRFQDGLESRFMSYQLDYKLIYSQPPDDTVMFLNFESEQQIGRIRVSVSGECDMEVHDKTSGQNVFNEIHYFKSEKKILRSLSEAGTIHA